MKDNTKREIDRKPAGQLMILGCSHRKNGSLLPTLALHLYDGVNNHVLRKILLERDWPAGPQVKILSAKYKLIDATEIISCYEQRLDKPRARKINREVLEELRALPALRTVFVNLGQDYMPSVKGLKKVFRGSEIIVAVGSIGMKMQAMKQWLVGLNCRTATVRGHLKKKSLICISFLTGMILYMNRLRPTKKVTRKEQRPSHKDKKNDRD